jgi:hypothetical protein
MAGGLLTSPDIREYHRGARNKKDLAARAPAQSTAAGAGALQKFPTTRSTKRRVQMKTIKCIVLTAAAAALMTACGGPAANQPLNSTANSGAKPAAEPPAKETLFAMEKEANEAYTKGNSAYFQTNLSDKFVMYPDGHRIGKAEAVAMIANVKCEMKSGPTLDDPQMATIDADTYVISYRMTADGTCTEPGGKAEKVPSPVRAASIWVRNGSRWDAAFHGETLIMEAKNAPAADDKKPAAKADDKSAPKADDKVAKSADDKMATSDDGKKTAKADDHPTEKAPEKKIGENKTAPGGKPADNTMAKADDKSAASNSGTAPTKASPDANTEALAKTHAAGWEAFRNKDKDFFDKAVTAGVSFVGPDGSWHSGKTDVINLWTTMDCTGMTKTSFRDAVATALSPTLEILTGIGTADGTCMGQKNGDLYNTAVYLKEGNDWHLAFMFESPKM